MAIRSPLTLTGWLALGAAVGSAGLAFLALRLPDVAPELCTAEGVQALPSGREARICEVLEETQPFTSVTWLVVRAVVPDLPAAAGQAGHGDHDTLCLEVGLPAAAAMTPPPERIVVQLMAEAFPRGEPAPGIAQSIEAYAIAEGTCIWELL